MAGLSDPGRLRERNEDAIAARPDIGLAVLADGMGGHQAGDVASRMAVDIVTRRITEHPAGPAPAVEEAIQQANSAIYDAAQGRADYRGMGSTVVVALFSGSHLWVAHVGDSRLYRLRDGRLEQLTRDHSLIQELVNRGLFTAEEARQSVAKNLVTRALGVDASVAPDITEETLRVGDIYLLCSDGLNDVLSDEEIEQILTQHPDRLNEAAQRMIADANRRGGPDNVSVVLAQVTEMDGDNATDIELHEI